MCTKHEGCRSEKSAAPTIKSVSCSASPKIQSIHPAGATNSEGGCCSSSSCSGADGPDEDEPAGEPQPTSRAGVWWGWIVHPAHAKLKRLLTN